MTTDEKTDELTASADELVDEQVSKKTYAEWLEERNINVDEFKDHARKAAEAATWAMENGQGMGDALLAVWTSGFAQGFHLRERRAGEDGAS